MDRRGRLLYIPPGRDGILVGTSTIDYPAPHSYSTAVFLSSDGHFMVCSESEGSPNKVLLQELLVPFHLSALDASESTVHDENLLKEVGRHHYLFRQIAALDKAISTHPTQGSESRKVPGVSQFPEDLSS